MEKISQNYKVVAGQVLKNNTPEKLLLKHDPKCLGFEHNLNILADYLFREAFSYSLFLAFIFAEEPVLEFSNKLCILY